MINKVNKHYIIKQARERLASHRFNKFIRNKDGSLCNLDRIYYIIKQDVSLASQRFKKFSENKTLVFVFRKIYCNHIIKILFSLLFLISLNVSSVFAETVNMDINGNSADTLEIIALLTVISLLPSILIMMTSFTRIIIVLSLLKNALGLQQTPPNQVLIGIAIFLTLFIMSPVIEEINTVAYEPYKNEQINQEEFFDKASVPLKEFMLKQTGKDELQMFMDMSRDEEIKNNNNIQELPLTIVVPSFITSELRRAFIVGFLLYIPFLIIDMIVSSVLMSMGMMMLPPVMISMPFKLLMFVVVDGWSLLFKTLITTFNY